MKCIEMQWKKSRCKSKYVDNYNKCECQRKGRDCQIDFFFFKEQHPAVCCLQRTHFRLRQKLVESNKIEKDIPSK